MFEFKKGIDILSDTGKIATPSEAKALFREKCDAENLEKLDRVTHQEVLLKIANAISMINPDSVFVNTGSEEDLQKIREMSIGKGDCLLYTSPSPRD